MADFWYNQAKKELMDGTTPFTSGSDLRVLLLTTDEENPDRTSVSAIISAGAVECAASGYARQALAGEAVAQDDTNDRAEFDANDVVFSAVAASAAIVAAVIYKEGANDGARKPIAHIDSGFPVTPNGSDITIAWNAEGILHLT